ncbi:hypothetical protein BASA82_000920 [Batrachochytrium salamandrivorans]|uniref:AB hydrolase-1 domain-containing protein n=1 Tax=Batrachochytrium salamandrivorans TaxID=1357716 RepID=A0ABQ8FMW2_9FUNG|nr:hypothetical protein BASA60_009287 [Batrachochytrium salamandrivorans]KAH6567573.1 hypothetical protein BASA62_006044 [Batrachochytrium salamandrivorans]KAH6588336.1 hypothetical protein BASA61_005979 [Batrachochytrium salamandrivorans]KAH6601028.1 hypothetical protein BASA50_001923 [Batrachochytrium salamandrivorans]KAH9257176.1 hypothetical protein BASA81_004565 [Batrachochytrium salamandrivorans]
MDYTGNEVQFRTPSGLCIAGRHWGYKNGFPLLALHGWLDNCATWEELIPVWASKFPHLKFDMMAIDFAGHGQSDHRSLQASYSKILDLEDCISVADLLNWDRFMLLGHSMGGLVSLYLAGLFPARIVNVVIIEAIAPLYTRDEVLVDRAALGISEDLRYLSRKNPEASKRVFASLEDAVRARTTGKHKISHRAGLHLVRRGTKAVLSQADSGLAYSTLGLVWSSDQRTLVSVQFSTSQVFAMETLRRIKCSLFCIMADHAMPQTLASPKVQEILGDKLSIVKLKGVQSHHLHLELEYAERIAGLIAQFWIKELSGDACKVKANL